MTSDPPSASSVLEFAPALRGADKLRAAVFGPSGSGKTRFAIELARNLIGPDGKLGVIDTEMGRACEYADWVAFQTLRLGAFSVNDYIAAVGAAVRAQMDALVIDSLSHVWEGEGGLLDTMDRLPQKDKAYGKAWGPANTALRRLITVLSKASAATAAHPMHVICTLRAKTDWEPDEKGNRQPVGVSPVMKAGVEYEFSLVGVLEANHVLRIIKAPPGSGLDRYVGDSLNPQVSQLLLTWLGGGRNDQGQL